MDGCFDLKNYISKFTIFEAGGGTWLLCSGDLGVDDAVPLVATSSTCNSSSKRSSSRSSVAHVSFIVIICKWYDILISPTYFGAFLLHSHGFLLGSLELLRLPLCQPSAHGVHLGLSVWLFEKGGRELGSLTVGLESFWNPYLGVWKWEFLCDMLRFFRARKCFRRATLSFRNYLPFRLGLNCQFHMMAINRSSFGLPQHCDFITCQKWLLPS